MGHFHFQSPLFEQFYVNVKCKRADNNSWHIFQIHILRYKNKFEIILTFCLKLKNMKNIDIVMII